MTSDELPPTESMSASDEDCGAQIGPYKLLQEIGQGGMGTVYMAAQEQPVRRQVALKIIKQGMDTKQVVARFEAERQALAMMDHPNIAHVLDVGTTEQGRPFFVMELIKGLPFTRYCDNKHLDISQRLRLFKSVCDAVQHAHQKGIIHRDLKPSNILVAEYDGKPVPKIIDFGLAKAMHQPLTDKTMFTQLGQVVGTLEYMSPEQSTMNQLEVDTRTDIYSLGVLLYELLTGAGPFDKKRIRSAALDQVLKIIREEDPPKPSLRLSTVESSAEVALQRGLEPKRLGSMLRGDLDWIVMKAMEKERDRRYETANGLKLDIERYIAGDPVLAVPPSVAYRLSKFVRRNTAAVIAATLITAALVLAVIGTSAGMVWAVKEGRRANVEAARARRLADSESRAKLEAEANQRKAAVAEQAAKARAADLELVTRFQAERLSQIDVPLMGTRLRADLRDKVREHANRLGLSPQDIEKRTIDFERLIAGLDFTGLSLMTLDKIIFDGTIETIESQFSDQPMIRARLLQSMASTARQLGLWELAASTQQQALALYRQELPPDHPETLASMYQLGRLLHDKREVKEAEKYLRQAMVGQRRTLGDAHLDTLATIHWLGNTLVHLQDYEESDRLLQESLDGRRLALGDDHPDTLEAIHDLGILRKQQGRPEEAEAYYLQSISGYRRVLGNDHPDTLIALSNMARLLQQQQRLEEAARYGREVLDGQRRVLGNDHPSTLASTSLLGVIAFARKEYQEAETLHREALEGHRRILGNEHQSTRYSIGWLRAVLLEQHQLAAAEPFLHEELEYARAQNGINDLETQFAISRYATTLARLHRFSEAEKVYRELLEYCRREHPDADPMTLFCLYQLGWLRSEQSDFAEARVLLEESLEGMQTRMQDKPTWWKSYYVAAAQSRLGAALAGEKKFDDAEPLLLEGYRGLRQNQELRTTTPNQPSPLAEALQRLVSYCEARHLAEPAAGYDLKQAEWQAKLVQLGNQASVKQPQNSQRDDGN